MLINEIFGFGKKPDPMGLRPLSSKEKKVLIAKFKEFSGGVGTKGKAQGLVKKYLSDGERPEGISFQQAWKFLASKESWEMSESVEVNEATEGVGSNSDADFQALRQEAIDGLTATKRVLENPSWKGFMNTSETHGAKVVSQEISNSINEILKKLNYFKSHK
jgi:hypothetical protein